MTLTYSEAVLLEKMFNSSIKMAMNSGIPIGQEFYKDIDSIKDKLREEIINSYSKEKMKNYWKDVLKEGGSRD